MIKSCNECKVKCCKTGPGPYKKVSPEKYLENFGTVDAYNTKCSALNRKGMCSLWGTPKFPIECRTYVCQTRAFSKKELSVIDDIIGVGCLNCDADYLLNDGVSSDGKHFYRCESCGSVTLWGIIK